MRRTTQLAAIALVLALAFGGVSSAAAADAEASDVERIAEIDLSIENEEFTIDGATITGDRLPSLSIDERTYEIDSFSVQTDGLTVEYGDTVYHVCELDIAIENVELTLSDTSIGSE
jgi:hypothetical protein